MAESEDRQRLQETRKIWDQAASGFDQEPDHGLRDPVVRAAWTVLLRHSIPLQTGKVLDIGCGTGSLSLVLSELGFDVTAIDLSPEMLAIAREKADLAGRQITFLEMDAAYPQFPAAQFDLLVCRHLLWALPDPKGVLEGWSQLLRPGGYLFLVEGFWLTGSGLHAKEVTAALPPTLALASTRILNDQPKLWGKDVQDERYSLLARRTR